VIRTVTVCAGESSCALAAHQYAIEIARWFEARLRVVSAWEAEEIRDSVVVISIEKDIGRAAFLTAVAQEYLKGFRLPSVDIVERSGDPESETAIFEAAESWRTSLWWATGPTVS